MRRMISIMLAVIASLSFAGLASTAYIWLHSYRHNMHWYLYCSDNRMAFVTHEGGYGAIGYLEGFLHQYGLDAECNMWIHGITRVPINAMPIKAERVKAWRIGPIAVVAVDQGTFWHKTVMYPLWLTASLLLLACACAVYMFVTRIRSASGCGARKCSHCGYCMLHNESGRCPECGQLVFYEDTVSKSESE